MRTGTLVIHKGSRDMFWSYQQAAKQKRVFNAFFAVYKGVKPFVLSQLTVTDDHYNQLSVDLGIKFQKAEPALGELAKLILNGSAVEGIDDMWQNRTR